MSLLVFDSLKDVNSWWSMETDRFDANVWIRSSPDTGCVEDVETSGAGAEEIGSSPRAPRLWHVYCVEDTGVGILERDLSIIAKAYRQVSEGACKVYQGTGLGLHICLTRVEAMLGRLGVASVSAAEGKKRGKSGGGSFFAVALPLLCPASDTESAEWTAIDAQEVKNDVDTLAAKAAGVVAAITGAGSDQGDNITGPYKEVAFFVVDDSTVNVKLMTKKIEQVFKHNRGRVKVLSATDGLTALEVLRNMRCGEAKHHNADIDATTVLAGCFMDYHMPNVDGVECTKRVRLLEAEKAWPR